MNTIALFPLFAAATASSAVPDPCIVPTLSLAAVEGIAAGLQVAFGIALADLVMLTVAWSAIPGAITLSESVFAALKAAGIVAIVLIALTMLRDAPRVSGASHPCRTLGDVAAGRGARALRHATRPRPPDHRGERRHAARIRGVRGSAPDMTPTPVRGRPP